MTTNLLDGIELVVFDKDGTLIDFHAMWGGWVRALADDLTNSTGQPLTGVLFELLGVDPTTGLVHSHGLLAATPMSRIRELVVETVIEHGLTPAAAELAVRHAWHPPDPIELAHPLADLPTLFGALQARSVRIAIATSDNRGPTEATVAALGVGAWIAAMRCADDGIPVKPAPDPVLELCAELGVRPERTAVIGDSPADVAMGRAAGAGLVVGVLTGVGDRAALAGRADVILDSIAGLLPA
jgi:phosphoglycolate phosphatase